MRRGIGIVLLLALVLVAGCTLTSEAPPPDTETPTVTPSDVVSPTATQTATSTASPTPDKSATPTLTFTASPYPTFTRVPTDTPRPPTSTPLPTATFTASPVPDARVKADADQLRLRDQPGTITNLVGSLNALTPLKVLGRTSDNMWLQVQTYDGLSGWVSSAYIDLNINLYPVPITGEEVVFVPTNTPFIPTQPPATNTPVVVNPTSVPAGNPTDPPVVVNPTNPPVVYGGYISGVTSHSRQIYLNGQQLGNRANVFSKVGDSITVATYVYYPIGWGQYNLQNYSDLQPVVYYFSSATARTSNSFANDSLSADNGWTTSHILDPGRAAAGICQAGETPIQCEYRVVKPSVALIMVGTNDVAVMSGADYAFNLGRIVQTSIDMGVIPVLSTIPLRNGFDAKVSEFNSIVINTARANDIPLWDYAAAMAQIPNGGLSSDGAHPSWPPGDYWQSANFTYENLQYGYTMRNLTALQALDAVWRQVLSY
jgi:hypothetical protein